MMTQKFGKVTIVIPQWYHNDSSKPKQEHKLKRSKAAWPTEGILKASQRFKPEATRLGQQHLTPQ